MAAITSALLLPAQIFPLIAVSFETKVAPPPRRRLTQQRTQTRYGFIPLLVQADAEGRRAVKEDLDLVRLHIYCDRRELNLTKTEPPLL